MRYIELNKIIINSKIIYKLFKIIQGNFVVNVEPLPGIYKSLVDYTDHQDGAIKWLFLIDALTRLQHTDTTDKNNAQGARGARVVREERFDGRRNLGEKKSLWT